MAIITTIYTGNTTFIPDFSGVITVEAWGAGGGGAGESDAPIYIGGAGGGGGAYAKITYSVISGNSYQISIGIGGAGGYGSIQGRPISGVEDDYVAGDTYFNNTTTLLAKGGWGGKRNGGPGGDGGSALLSVGDVKFSGGRGETGQIPVDIYTRAGGYGGSSAGINADGWSGPLIFNNNIYPVLNTPNGAGYGGDGNGWLDGVGDGHSPISGYGGGGGGAWGAGAYNFGGNGWSGKIVITYNTIKIYPIISSNNNLFLSSNNLLCDL